ncbi:MAG: FtsQ-type POTRA domain-containing protein [Polyangiaceae bacterium]|nr:FtsQ-type POTRA domain-containing protein [Polyangiaceae bacterium]
MSARTLPENRRLAPREPRAPGDGPTPPARASAFASAFARRLGALRWPGRARGALRLAAGAIVFAAATASSSYGLLRYARTSPRFAVKHVEIEGAKRRDGRVLARAAGAVEGANVFAFDAEAARAALLADPWVEEAIVTRRLPSTLTLKVREREATALVALDRGLFLVGPGGMPFKRFEPGDPVDLVLITGLEGGAGGPAADRDGFVALVKIAQEVIRDYDRLPSSRRHPLQQVHVTDEGGLEVVVGRDAVVLSLGRGPYRAKLERASRVLAEVERRKARAAVVFADNDTHPERVVARLR